MKKLMMAVVASIVFATTTSAATNADTLTINSSNISKVVTDTYLTNKGVEKMKYYFIINDELIPTTSTVIKYYELAKKHNCKVSLAVVKTKTGKKVILLNK